MQLFEQAQLMSFAFLAEIKHSGKNLNSCAIFSEEIFATQTAFANFVSFFSKKNEKRNLK